MANDIKDNFLQNKFYYSLKEDKILLIGGNNPNEISDIAKNGLNVDVIEDNEIIVEKLQRRFGSNPRVNIVHNDIFDYSASGYNTIVLLNNVKEYRNIRFLFDKVFNQLLLPNGNLVLYYDTSIEWENLITSKVIDYSNENIGIGEFYVNDNKILSILNTIGKKLQVSYMIEQLEITLYNKIQQKEIEIKQPATNTNRKSEDNLTTSNKGVSFTDYNNLLSKYNEMVTTNKIYRMEAEKHKKKANEIRATVRYKIGDEVVHSFKKPGKRTIKLPFTLYRLLKQGRVNEKQRQVRRANKNKVKRATPIQNLIEVNEKEVNNSIIIEKIRNTELYKRPLESKNFPDIKVACILDEFSYMCYQSEADFYQLSYRGWKEELEKVNPDILFVESAWMGDQDKWKYKLINIGKQADPEISKLVSYCKEQGIPTVFWNKEDPPNFDRFIDTAKLFDIIFTTEINVVDKYKQIVKHDNVFVLPFAAQPELHNPVDISYNEKKNVAFAGSWYANRHFERQLDMNNLLGPARNYNLEIYDRFFDYKENDNYKFPEIYRQYIVGKLDYEDMIKAYRLYQVFLNVNSVNDSETMFSRRVFEILASGTNVISSKSLGVEKMFPEVVLVSDSEQETDNYLEVLTNNIEFARRKSVQGIREVYSNHLYFHRFQDLLKKVGLVNEGKESEGVTVITSTKRPQFIENIIKNFENQLWDKKELVIVLNDDNFNLQELESRVNDHPNVKVISSPELTLGECLNEAIEASSYDYIAKFDDDDYYGPHYLTDAMHSFVYTDASIVGKKSIFMYFEDNKTLALKYPFSENKFQHFVYGATLVFKKEVWEKCRFTNTNTGEDSKFLKGALDQGYKIFSTNPYNYTYVRQSTSAHHTWQIDNSHLLRRAKIVGYMKDFVEHVTV